MLRSFHFARWRRALILSLASFFGPFPGSAQSQTKPPATSFVALSKRADEARDADRLDEAVSLYRRALLLRPSWEDGWWSLGTIYYDQDAYANASQAFAMLLKADPKNGTAHAMLGLSQFELGKDEPALKNLLAAERFGIVKDEQLRKVALYHLGVLQLRARKYGDSHETLEQLARDGVRTKQLIIALGQSALLIRPQESPAEDTQEARVIERAGEAEALLATKEAEPAKQIYVGLVSEFPNYQNLHFAYGRLLLETHETDEAVEEFQQELNRDPKNVNSLLEIASVRYRVDSQDGLKYAEAAVKLAPRLPFAHYLLGLLLLDTGNVASAIPEFEIARKAFPTEAKVYFSLGSAYARMGRKAEAAKARAEFVRLNAQGVTQPGSNVYGEQPSGVSGEQLRSVDRGKPPQ